MVFGLGSKHADTATKKSAKKASSKSQSDEAAELLKKMEAKKDAGSCPFC